MKFIISVLLIALLSFAACLYLPWWSIAPAAFIVTCLIHQRPLAAFLSGFIALLLLWGILSWWISRRNEHLLAHKMSVLIIKSDNVFLLVLITALIGAVVGGLAALAGSFLVKAVKASSRE